MSSFTKLDSGIVHSTIWVQPHDVLRVWIAMLALADQHGVARTAAPSLANLCMIPVDRMREILHILESPDEDSRSEAEEGRRIIKIAGGWQLVNHAAYRNKRDPDAELERKREWDRQHRPSGHARAKQSDTSPTVRHQSDVNPTSPTQAEADTDTEKGKSKELAPQGDVFAGIDPQTVADFKSLRSRLRAPITPTAIAGIKREAAKAGISFEDALVMCCERGWRGFKAEWVGESQQARAGPVGAAPMGKQMQGVMALEELKNGARQRLAAGGSGDRPAETLLLVAGSDTRR